MIEQINEYIFEMLSNVTHFSIMPNNSTLTLKIILNILSQFFSIEKLVMRLIHTTCMGLILSDVI